MLDYIREGDIVLDTELDRLGRNNQDLTKIMNTIQNKGATLDVLNLPSMTGIADPNLRQLMTNLIIELYKYQAESERKRIIERQQQGIALAKQQGKYHGRKPQYAKDDPRLQHAFKLYRAGMSDIDVSRNTGSQPPLTKVSGLLAEYHHGFRTTICVDRDNLFDQLKL